MSDESNQEPLERVTGGCMCGKVKFEVNAPLLGAARCYCKRCQRRTGTAFSQTGLTQPGSFRITDGEEHVKMYEPGGDGWNKGFCAECGSHLLTRNAENPDLLAVRMGALDQDPQVPGEGPSVRRLRGSLVRDPRRRLAALRRENGLRIVPVSDVVSGTEPRTGRPAAGTSRRPACARTGHRAGRSTTGSSDRCCCCLVTRTSGSRSGHRCRGI
ncbi:MAG: GFA family protein [Solirubrobacterales bacterium]|nr:GFA family protein [Solirubrobacterales bacterium]